jgi:hypothetical protein
MADVGVAEAVGAGFALIRRRPLTVVVWGLSVGVFLLLAILFLGPQLGAFIARVRNAALTQAWTPDFAGMARFQSSIMLVNIAGLFIRAVLIGAVFRAVLKPQDGAFAYMRVGIVELFLAVLLFGGGIAFVMLIVAVGAPFVLAVVWLAMAHNIAAAVVTGLVGGAFVLFLVAWLALRLSLLGPMIVDSGGFPLGEAWVLTRGRTGSLFLIALLLFVIMIALETLVFGVVSVFGLGLLSGLPHGPQALQVLASRPTADLLAGLAPVLVLVWLVWSLVVGLACAILLAPWAAVYRQLAPVETESVSA